MTHITFTSQDPTAIDTDAVVTFISSTDDTDPTPVVPALHTPAILAALRDIEASCDAGETTVLPSCHTAARRIVAVGCNANSTLTSRRRRLDDGLEIIGTGRMRHLSATGVRTAKARRIVLVVDATSIDDVIDAGVGAIIGSHSIHSYRSDHEDTTLESLTIATDVAIEDAHAIVHEIFTLADAVISVMDLVNRAPNDLYPERFSQEVEQRVSTLPISCEIWDEQRLLREGCGGISAVGQGSTRPPRLVVLSYEPHDARRSVALIGKGITFDSGGLSLKPAKSMETMKSDMTGAATVTAVIAAVAALGIPVAVHAYLALAENMPDGGGVRPSDVITMRNAMTVEVLNTDAEGRLVMADALALAAETDVDAIIDVATLTGAQMVGLGTRTAGVMGSDEVRDAVVASANRTGEAMWPMPLPTYLKSGLSSRVADLANSGPRWGGMLTAGVFLQEFVGEKPWAHIDIAGPSFNEDGAWGASNSGGTGMSVLTLIDWVRQLCAESEPTSR